MSMRIFARMRNTIMSRLVMIVVAMSLFACGPADTFRPLTQSELEAFSREQGVTFLNQLTFDDATLLIYEKGTSFGYYGLSVREPDGEMVLSQLSATRSDDPILVMGQRSGTYPFVAVIIQDPMLLTQTVTVEVTVDSQSPLSAANNGESSVILVSPALANGWIDVTLYGADGEVLYTQGG